MGGSTWRTRGSRSRCRDPPSDDPPMTKPVFKSTGGPGSTPPPKKGAGPQFTEEHSAGDFLFREGELGTEMFILQEGQVEILKTVNGVDEQLAVLEKGDF